MQMQLKMKELEFEQFMLSKEEKEERVPLDYLLVENKCDIVK